MLLALRQAIAKRIEYLLEGAGFLISLSGATVVGVMGKLMLAVVLAAVALGFFLRLTGRRAPLPLTPMKTPLWVFFISAVLSVIEVAILAEATDLPVRFYQPGFEMHHWVLVLIALLVAFVVQLQIFRAMRWRQNDASKS